LTIYGDTDSYANLEQYEKINRNVEIEFAGQIENIDDDDFEKFDFAVHPSRTEGLSNAIIEELAAGLPVIAFKVGGNSELIIDNQNGYLINPFDTKVFGEKINNLLENPKLIATLASNTDILIRDLSWKNVVNTHLNVYGL
jgi:glycosyltransferase involved in cell wall biosynthesis